MVRHSERRVRSGMVERKMGVTQDSKMEERVAGRKK